MFDAYLEDSFVDGLIESGKDASSINRLELRDGQVPLRVQTAVSLILPYTV